MYARFITDSTFQRFTVLSLVGLLVAGASLASLIRGTGSPLTEGLLLGGGLWLTLIALVVYREGNGHEPVGREQGVTAERADAADTPF